MRIVSGTARGKKLVSFSGQNIRPTSDRTREAVFSSLFSRLGRFHGTRVLDLFAGTGAMGIEALSRGAATALFVDNNAQAVQIILQNLEICGFREKAEILRKDIRESWSQLEKAGPFDIIFLDPPYGRDLIAKTIRTIAMGGLLASQGILCAETSHTETVADDFSPLILVKTSRYGSTGIHFFQISDEGGKE